jgi:hypothetical protein
MYRRRSTMPSITQRVVRRAYGVTENLQATRVTRRCEMFTEQGHVRPLRSDPSRQSTYYSPRVVSFVVTSLDAHVVLNADVLFNFRSKSFFHAFMASVLSASLEHKQFIMNQPISMLTHREDPHYSCRSCSHLTQHVPSLLVQPRHQPPNVHDANQELTLVNNTRLADF